MRSLLFILLLALLTAIRPAARGQTFETLFADNQGRTPSSSLVQGSDGNFYGTTSEGGTSGLGTVFKMTPAGALATLVSFNNINGSSPYGALVEGSDGNFYGTTSRGGTSGYGTVFKMTPAGELTTLVSFNRTNGSYPYGGLVKGSDGNFYGTAAGDGGTSINGAGRIFKVTPAGGLSTLVLFDYGSRPRAGLTLGSDGNFYGTTSGDGTNVYYGTIFRMTPAGALTTLVTFNNTNGSNPYGGLVEGSDGNFYGTTSEGGTSGAGTVFKMTPAGTLTTLVSLNNTNGSRPRAGLIVGSDGNFYGTTERGGTSGYGTVFKMTPAGELITLVSFNRTNGSYPYGGVVEGSDGNFYGTAAGDGTNVYYGTVFRMTPTGALTRLVTFNNTNGSNPYGGLVKGSDGNFYGTAEGGGASGYGTIFKVTPAGALTTLVSFNYSNGSRPRVGLIVGSDGNFYGATNGGGASGYGTVFKMTPAGVLTTLVSFNGFNGGIGGLVEGSDGNFYGTTAGGGASGYGTVFKVTPAGALTTLVTFNGTNGRSPYGRLVEGSDGNFYGTTNGGLASGHGTVFRMTPAGELATLVTFNGGNGSSPYGGLAEGSDGNFYGTTSEGGTSGLGTVFKMTRAGELTTLVSFNNTNGSSPYGGLVEGSDGNFYGTTKVGGASGCGTVFKVTATGVLTTLHSFDGVVAAQPEGAPVFGSDGNLYGTAAQITIWRLFFVSAPAVTTNAPSSIVTTGATLHGIVSPHAADTTATFEYGLTPNYGSSIVANPGTVTGTSATVVSAMLSGLAPHTTYYYRLTASNSEGSRSTTGASFTTANTLPVTTDDSFVTVLNDLGAITIAVLENDSDADGDLLAITATTQGSFGSVSTDGITLTYTPGPGFLGHDTFSYTISDGIDTVTAQVKLRAPALVTRVLLSKDSEVLGAGQTNSGIPSGALFKSFGVPSINSAGRLAFIASYGAQGSPGEFSVFVLDPQTTTSTLAARRGQAAPGTNGALFSSFKDPLLNEAGDVAFLATLSGGDVTKQNSEGLWICPSSTTGGSGSQLAARSGAQPPGAPVGARWKSFTSVAFAGVRESNTSWSLAFTAYMAPGAGGVSTGNDMGLWIARPEGTLLALREGQKLQIGGAEKKLRTFAALMPLSNALGQGNGSTSAGAVAVQAFFTDGSQAMLRVSGAVENDNVIIEALALPGDAVTGHSGTAAKFGISSQSSSGTATAWLGSLSGKGSPAAIFERNLSEPELLKLLARKGDATPGIEGASFSTFRSVAVSDTGDALFLGKVSGKGISGSSDEGLWWKQGSADNASLQLLAREGAQPPGVAEGARWSSFTSLALSEGPYGPLFTAKLAISAKGKGPGKITGANDQGLWAVDSKGELQLVAQEGQEVSVEGSSTPKTLKGFTVLSAVPGSPAQRRSFAGDGQIVYRALFTDGSQAIVKVQLP